MQTCDLNADVGEGFGYDEQLMQVVSSANVACGFHAGDAATMRRLCDWAVEHGVAVGAQFSYRDREGFGRRDIDVSPEQLHADLVEQVEALTEAAEAAGTRVRYLKPHGALYNRAVWDDERAGVVATVARRFGLPVLTLAGSRLAVDAESRGVGVRREFFADRGYDEDGHLVPRSEPNAVVTDAATVIGRVRKLVTDGTVTTVAATTVPAVADSICLHGDTAGALELARAVRATLGDLGVRVAACA